MNLLTIININGQTILDAFLVNNSSQNNDGLLKIYVFAHSDGNNIVVWQKYNDLKFPFVEQPRILFQPFIKVWINTICLCRYNETIGRIKLFAYVDIISYFILVTTFPKVSLSVILQKYLFKVRGIK